MIKFKEFPWADECFDDYETIEGDIRYYITPEGNLPSMTSLLKQLDDGGIQKWKDRVGDKEAQRITKEATDRGNSLHDYNELYLQNKLSRKDLKGQARTLFNRVKTYLDDIELMVATEVALYSKENSYAGRVDAIGIIDGQLMIIDHKNSRKPIDLSSSWGRKKIFKYFLQLHGYKRALFEMKGLDARYGCLIVGNHLTSNSDRFICDLDLLYTEFDKLVKCFYDDRHDIKESFYFKEQDLKELILNCVVSK